MNDQSMLAIALAPSSVLPPSGECFERFDFNRPCFIKQSGRPLRDSSPVYACGQCWREFSVL